MGQLGQIARRQVLFVDDDDAWLRAVRRLVKPMRSLIIHTETNVPDAMAAIAERPPRIVITNIELSGVADAGLTIVKAAKRAGVPVAVLTGGLAPRMRSRLRGVLVFDKRRFAQGNVAALLDHLSRFQTEWGNIVERVDALKAPRPVLSSAES